jgi:hypothetical protein
MNKPVDKLCLKMWVKRQVKLSTIHQQPIHGKIQFTNRQK